MRRSPASAVRALFEYELEWTHTKWGHKRNEPVWPYLCIGVVTVMALVLRVVLH